MSGNARVFVGTVERGGYDREAFRAVLPATVFE